MDNIKLFEDYKLDEIQMLSSPILKYSYTLKYTFQTNVINITWNSYAYFNRAKSHLKIMTI